MISYLSICQKRYLRLLVLILMQYQTGLLIITAMKYDIYKNTQCHNNGLTAGAILEIRRSRIQTESVD